jgi:DGQHR domain-containing protein
MSYSFLLIEQPAGTFYLTAMPARDVVRLAIAKPRVFNSETLTSEGGIQREPSERRVKAVAEYAGTSDAAFPTAVLLSVKSESCVLQGDQVSFVGEGVADIVDGQHRVEGLRLAGEAELAKFTLPVVLIIDATDEEKALLFATINGTQTKVPASLVYDLYGVSESRSPAKTCHEIARSLNSMLESPWYRRLKMLGRKSSPDSLESLSQGTFVKFLLPLVSANPEADAELIKNGKPPGTYPKCAFNEYFRKDKDSQILKVLLNVFGAAREVWPTEWADPDEYVLTKTLGFSGIMKALPDLVKAGRERRELSAEYFTGVFAKVKDKLDAANSSLASGQFSASASGEAKFRDFILAGLKSYLEGL